MVTVEQEIARDIREGFAMFRQWNPMSPIKDISFAKTVTVKGIGGIPSLVLDAVIIRGYISFFCLT